MDDTANFGELDIQKYDNYLARTRKITATTQRNSKATKNKSKSTPKKTKRTQLDPEEKELLKQISSFLERKKLKIVAMEDDEANSDESAGFYSNEEDEDSGPVF